MILDSFLPRIEMVGSFVAWSIGASIPVAIVWGGWYLVVKHLRSKS